MPVDGRSSRVYRGFAVVTRQQVDIVSFLETDRPVESRLRTCIKLGSTRRGWRERKMADLFFGSCCFWCAIEKAFVVIAAWRVGRHGGEATAEPDERGMEDGTVADEWGGLAPTVQDGTALLFMVTASYSGHPALGSCRWRSRSQRRLFPEQEIARASGTHGGRASADRVDFCYCLLLTSVEQIPPAGLPDANPESTESDLEPQISRDPHPTASLLDGDDELKNAAVLVIPPTSAALLLILHPLIHPWPSRRCDHQTPPRQSQLSRHRHLPLHPQAQRHRTSREDQPVPPQHRQVPWEGGMGRRLGLFFSEVGAARFG